MAWPCLTAGRIAFSPCTCHPPVQVPVARAEPRQNRKKKGGAEWAGLLFGQEEPLQDFIESVRAGEDTATDADRAVSAPTYGFDFSVVNECTELFQKIDIPKYFSYCALQRHYVHATNDADLPPLYERAFQWPSLMMGQRGSRSELHYDQAGLPFWMAVLRGRKLFRVLPMADNVHLTPRPPDENADWPTPDTAATKHFASNILDEYMGDSGGYLFSALPTLPLGDQPGPELVRGPDFVRFPRLCDASMHQAFVGPGDVIFIPPGAPHGAVNLDTTIALTSNFLSPRDDLASRAWFARKCARNHPEGIDVPPHVCEALLNQPDVPALGKRVARSYFEMAGFGDATEWCDFKALSFGDSDELDPRAMDNFQEFCSNLGDDMEGMEPPSDEEMIRIMNNAEEGNQE